MVMTMWILARLRISSLDVAKGFLFHVLNIFFRSLRGRNHRGQCRCCFMHSFIRSSPSFRNRNLGSVLHT